MTFTDPQATMHKSQQGTKGNIKLPTLVTQACGSNRVSEPSAMLGGSMEKGLETAALKV